MIKTALTKSLLAASIAFVSATSAFAGTVVSKEVIVEEEPVQWWNAEISFGIDSKYMFRGYDQFAIRGLPAAFSNVVRSNSPLIYTDLSFSAYGFTAGVWYGDNLIGTRGGFNELDVYADYTYSFGPVDLSVGYIGYFFPDLDVNSNHEAYVGAAYTAIPYVTPSVTWYQGFGRAGYQGRYLEVKLEGDIPVYEGVVDVSLQPYALISYSDYNVVGRSNWNHYQIGLNVTVGLSDNISVYAGINYSGPLDVVSSGSNSNATGSFGAFGDPGYHVNSDIYGGGGVTFSF